MKLTSSQTTLMLLGPPFLHPATTSTITLVTCTLSNCRYRLTGVAMDETYSMLIFPGIVVGFYWGREALYPWARTLENWTRAWVRGAEFQRDSFQFSRFKRVTDLTWGIWGHSTDRLPLWFKKFCSRWWGSRFYQRSSTLTPQIVLLYSYSILYYV